MVEARCVCASRKVPGRAAARRPPGQGTGCVDVRACVDTDAEPIDQLAAEPARYDREACADERENGCERRGRRGIAGSEPPTRGVRKWRRMRSSCRRRRSYCRCYPSGPSPPHGWFGSVLDREGW